MPPTVSGLAVGVVICAGVVSGMIVVGAAGVTSEVSGLEVGVGLVGVPHVLG